MLGGCDHFEQVARALVLMISRGNAGQTLIRDQQYMNLSLIQKSLSRISLNDQFNAKDVDSEDGDFAWIKSVPTELQFSLNM